MLLINNVAYQEWTPPKEDDYEQIIKQHVDQIFSGKSIYLEKKRILKSDSVAGIPDGLAITLEPEHFFIIEIELSYHPIYDHIMPQIGKFLAGYNNLKSNAILRDFLCKEIIESEQNRSLFNSEGEIYKRISKLLEKPPRLLIIIEKFTSALNDIQHSIKIEPEILEFKIFRTEESNKPEFVYEFKPIVSKSEVIDRRKQYQQFWRLLLKRIPSEDIRGKVRRVSTRTFQPIQVGKKGVHFEWVLYRNSINVDLHFETSDPRKNIEYLQSFENKKDELEKEINHSLIFDYRFHKKWTRICITRELWDESIPPIADEATVKWAIDMMIRLYKTCIPLLESLK